MFKKIILCNCIQISLYAIICDTTFIWLFITIEGDKILNQLVFDILNGIWNSCWITQFFGIPVKTGPSRD